ncbi:MAG: hypothetical protein JWN52_5910 [Actinomycetia bacterium]|nr:hypothetical protein [Actinomycetes bacterium]
MCLRFVYLLSRTATSCRSARISDSLAASLRANRNRQPTNRQKIKYMKHSVMTVEDAQPRPPLRPVAIAADHGLAAGF